MNTKKIILFMLLCAVQICAMSKRKPCNNNQIIIYEPTLSLLNNLRDFYKNKELIKAELLEQNELDGFSRASIEEVFTKTSAVEIMLLLENRLYDANGKTFSFENNKKK